MDHKSNKLEESLTNIDFYNVLANKEKIRQNFESKLKQGIPNDIVLKSKKRKRFIGIAASVVIALFFSTFVSADKIGQLLQEWKFGNMSARQYNILKDNDGSDVKNIVKYNFDTSEAGRVVPTTDISLENINSYEGLEQIIEFIPLIPSYLPSDMELEDIVIMKAGDTYLQQLIARYINVDQSCMIKIDQLFIGKEGTIEIESTDNFNQIYINETEVFIRMTDDKSGIGISWIQDRIGIGLNGVNISYEELIKVAKSIIN